MSVLVTNATPDGIWVSVDGCLGNFKVDDGVYSRESMLAQKNRSTLLGTKRAPGSVYIAGSEKVFFHFACSGESDYNGGKGIEFCIDRAGAASGLRTGELDRTRTNGCDASADVKVGMWEIVVRSKSGSVVMADVLPL